MFESSSPGSPGKTHINHTQPLQKPSVLETLEAGFSLTQNTYHAKGNEDAHKLN